MDKRQAADLLNEIADLIAPGALVGSALADGSPSSDRSGLGMVQEAKQLHRYSQTCGSDQVIWLVVGAFNNGKSTLVNALLEVEAVQTGAVPTTAVFTHLRDGKAAIVLHPRIGEPYPIDRVTYWDQCNLSADMDWQEVDHLEIQGEFERLPHGITLIDSPGLAEDRLRTALALEYLPHANAIIVVIDAKQPFSRAERNFLNLLGHGQLQNVFFAINRIDMLQPEELPQLQSWIHKQLRRYFTDRDGQFSEALYQRRVFFTNALAAGDHSLDAADGVGALRQALLDWQGQGTETATAAELQPLVPVLADVLHNARQRMDYQQSALRQPLETLEAQLAQSEERLQAMEQGRDTIRQRIRDAGDVMKHQIYSNLVSYIQSLKATWETDVALLDLDKLANLNIFSAKFSEKDQAEIADVLSQELQRYMQIKLVKWAQQLPEALKDSVHDLLADIGYELRCFQVELDEIAGLLGSDAGDRPYAQRRDAGLLEIDETLYREVFNDKMLFQLIRPLSDQLFTDLSANKRFMNIALSVLRAVFEAGSFLIFGGRGSAFLLGLLSRIGGDLVGQVQRRREWDEMRGGGAQYQQLDQTYGDLGAEKVEKLQNAVRESLAENLKPHLFEQMQDVILNKREVIFQQLEAEFDKISVTVAAKLDQAIAEVRTTQQQLVEMRRTYEGSLVNTAACYQALEQDLRTRVDRFCHAAIARTLSDQEIERLSDRRGSFLTRPAFAPDGVSPGALVLPALPSVSATSSSLSLNAFNSRLRTAVKTALGLEDYGDEEAELGSISAELSRMIGLTSVKQRILEMMDYQTEVQRRLASGRNLEEPPSLHLVFTGNPGTGKTTVAEIVGKMYRRLGLLKRGHVISVGREELVGAVIGQTEERVRQIIEKACDGVLFIDEAYSLVQANTPNDFGMRAVEALLRYMEKYRGRLAVLVAGYPREMETFLNANPGLRSRFPSYNVIDFPDYTPDELQQILDRMLAQRDYQLSAEARSQIEQVIAGLYASRDIRFGNAREIRTLVDSLIQRRAQRVRRNQCPVEDPIRPDDIDDRYRRFISTHAEPVDSVEATLERINQLIGLSTVKEAVDRLVARSRLSQRLGESVRADMLHMLFRGDPGTGKTTVAKEFGKILRGLGYLQRGQLVSVTRGDLVAGYIGQSEEKIRRVLAEAQDGVLFIDEAYSLFLEEAGNDFGRVVLNELTAYMDEHRGRLVVILAGYSDEIDALLTANPGLRDRFRTPIDFPSYSQTELMDICRKMAQEDGYTFAPGAEERISLYLERMRANDPDRFGNARVVRKLLDEMKGYLAYRISRVAETITDDAELRQLAKQLEAKDIPPLPKFTTPEKRLTVVFGKRASSEKPLDINILPPAADHFR